MLPSGPHPSSLSDWQALRSAGVWSIPLPHLARGSDRLLLRLFGAIALRATDEVVGLEGILPAADPFILVANHGSRREVIYVTALLLLARGGRPVHFLADWNFRLIPGIGYLYDRSGAITVGRKAAKPALLNRLKPLFTPRQSALSVARERLQAGASIALFPEGTINRGAHLLRGRLGAARLAIETDVAVQTLGIRFLPTPGGRAQAGQMQLRFGPRLIPPRDAEARAPSSVRRFNADIMGTLAGLCGKSVGALPAAERRQAAVAVSAHPTPSAMTPPT